MEQRISDYISQKLNQDGSLFKKGNLIAYNILIHISYEMLLNNSSEDEIKSRIDLLLTDPVISRK